MKIIQQYILLISLVLGIPSMLNAQIQRTFFKMELGKTSKQEVVNKLRSDGFEPKEITGGSLMITNVDFGGRAWTGVGFMFYKNKLSEVKFIKIPKPENLKYYFDNLKDNLNSKYKKYYIAELSKTNDIFYTDGATSIALQYSPNPESVILLYQDNQEIKDYIKEDSYEL